MTKAGSVLRHCVVCNQGSTRASWRKSLRTYVACDFHTDVEISNAVSKLEAQKKTGNDKRSEYERRKAAEAAKAKPVSASKPPVVEEPKKAEKSATGAA
jgi:hypothetical protein